MPNAPALLLETPGNPRSRLLVIADLHLGLGATPERPLGPPGGHAPELAASLLALARQAGAAKVIVAGDVKHPIVGTPRWLRPVIFDFFSELLARGLSVEVVLGNHDVGLVPHLPKEVAVIGAEGTVHGSVGIFHGHRWPAEAVQEAPTIVAGHLHPGFRFAPTAAEPDGKRRCWVRVQFPPPPPQPRGRRRPAHSLRCREVVVIPAFHPLAGSEALNREHPARGRSFLYRRILDQGSARAYLLDGTDLGTLPSWSGDGSIGAARPAHRPK